MATKLDNIQFPQTGCFVCVNPCPVPPYRQGDTLLRNGGSMINVQLLTGELFNLGANELQDMIHSIALNGITLSKISKTQRYLFLIQLIDEMYHMMQQEKFQTPSKIKYYPTLSLAYEKGRAMYYDRLWKLNPIFNVVDKFLEYQIKNHMFFSSKPLSWKHISPISMNNTRFRQRHVFDIIIKCGLGYTSSKKDNELFETLSQKIGYLDKVYLHNGETLNEYINILDKDYNYNKKDKNETEQPNNTIEIASAEIIKSGVDDSGTVNVAIDDDHDESEKQLYIWRMHKNQLEKKCLQDRLINLRDMITNNDSSCNYFFCEWSNGATDCLNLSMSV